MNTYSFVDCLRSLRVCVMKILRVNVYDSVYIMTTNEYLTSSTTMKRSGDKDGKNEFLKKSDNDGSKLCLYVLFNTVK